MAEESSNTASEYTDWHRILGIVFAEKTEGLPYQLDIDLDVATTEQRIDIVLAKTKANAPNPNLADGLENLRTHNLFTYKSFHEALDVYALRELISYGVLYEKRKAPKGEKQLPPSEIGLFAIATRPPKNLFNEPHLQVTQVKEGLYDVPGVYDVQYGPSQIRLIVIQELEANPRNANFLLFSSRRNQVEYGQTHHNLAGSRFGSLIAALLQRYREDPDMVGKIIEKTPDEIAEIILSFDHLFNDMKDRILKRLTVEEILQGIPTEKRLEGIPTEKLLEKVTPEKLLDGLSPDRLEQLRRLIDERTKKPDDSTSN